jgi:hypothetical protein
MTTPVGMTNLTLVQNVKVCLIDRLQIDTLSLTFVIPTGAYPDFLLRGATKAHVCGFP